ncbi:hypothetical protein [Herpetosiphon sp. NSE202]|uniref:hypothetical protein n=1 Tax=Herpetosiphon sp. NSE202 TaxID=3351349 RepID=UPI0036426AF3
MLAWSKRFRVVGLLLIGLSGCGNQVPQQSATADSVVQALELATQTPAATPIPTSTLAPTRVVHREVPDHPIGGMHNGFVTDTECEPNFNRIQLDPATEQLVDAAFEHVEFLDDASVDGGSDWLNCTRSIAEISYDFDINVVDTLEQLTLYQYAETLQAIIRDLQTQPSLQYRLGKIYIHWRYPDYNCSWGYQYLKTSTNDEYQWYLTDVSLQVIDHKSACEVPEDVVPSNACLASHRESVSDEDGDLIGSGFRDDQFSEINRIDTDRLYPDTTCDAGSSLLGYHFYVTNPANATTAMREDLAHQIQTIILDLRQYPTLDYPTYMLVITWVGLGGGCSWAYDYAEDAQGHAWYPRLSDILGSQGCDHQEVVQSANPQPIQRPIYACLGATNFHYYRIPSEPQEQVTQALQDAGIEANVSISGDGEGGECVYGIMNYSYYVSLERPANADQAQLQQQVATILNVITQQDFDVSMGNFVVFWKTGDLTCAWDYKSFYENETFVWKIERYHPDPCPE